MTRMRFEGADKAAEALLLLTPHDEEFEPEFLSLSPSNRRRVYVHRRSLIGQIETQFQVHSWADTLAADDYRRLPPALREVDHGSFSHDVIS